MCLVRYLVSSDRQGVPRDFLDRGGTRDVLGSVWLFRYL